MIEKNENCVYYAAAHQPESAAKLPNYIVPIQTGTALAPRFFCEIKDNTGTNISAKNREYCELTALYWIWKNDSHSIIGFNHYRRFFQLPPHSAVEILEKYDVIVPPAYFFRTSLDEEYQYCHSAEDWGILKRIVNNQHPELTDSVEHVFNNNRLIPYNMMIASRAFLEAYCEWLFPLLFEIEKGLNWEGRSSYQKRALGFMAERLFTLYIYAYDCSSYSANVMIPEMSHPSVKMKYKLGKIYNRFYFRGKQCLCTSLKFP